MFHRFQSRFDIYSCGQDYSVAYAVIQIKFQRDINLKLSIYYYFFFRAAFCSVLHFWHMLRRFLILTVIRLHDAWSPMTEEQKRKNSFLIVLFCLIFFI